jgi:glutamate--cysteine ligase
LPQDHHAPSYDEPGGIRDLLMALTEFGWEPVDGRRQGHRHGGRTAPSAWNRRASSNCRARRSKTCTRPAPKPGGTSKQVKAIGARTGKGFLGLGMWPDKTRDELPIMPKGRYAIMLRHMPRVGSMGLDMMLRTCTIQVNLDYSSEADMVQKFRVGLALQPLATALFANSPFHRRQAQRLPFLSQPHLVGHRSAPHRHAALRVRGRLRL